MEEIMEEVKKDVVVEPTKEVKVTTEDITMKALSMLDEIYGGKTPDITDIVTPKVEEETKVEPVVEETNVEEETKEEVVETKVEGEIKEVVEETKETPQASTEDVVKKAFEELSSGYQSIIAELKKDLKEARDNAPFGMQGKTAKIEQGDPTDIDVSDIYNSNNFGNKF